MIYRGATRSPSSPSTELFRWARGDPSRCYAGTPTGYWGFRLRRSAVRAAPAFFRSWPEPQGTKRKLRYKLPCAVCLLLAAHGEA
eukprot:scaffold3499_cov117-Isochrysis_galbana.AAC.16